MKSLARVALVLTGMAVLSCGLGAAACVGLVRQVTATVTPTPRFTDDDVRALAVVATYEAQVFPEPLKSHAYRAIVWTMRNRVEIGFGGAVRYSDERVLSRYSAYPDHKNDPPDPRAVEIVREVLTQRRTRAIRRAARGTMLTIRTGPGRTSKPGQR